LRDDIDLFKSGLFVGLCEAASIVCVYDLYTLIRGWTEAWWYLFGMQLPLSRGTRTGWIIHKEVRFLMYGLCFCRNLTVLNF